MEDYEITNGQQLLEQLRRKDGVAYRHQPTNAGELMQLGRNRQREEVAALEKATLSVESIYSGMEVDLVNREEMAAHYGITLLDDLVTDHMPADKAAEYQSLIFNIRQWREMVRDMRGQFFVLSSPQVGIGKTHMAKAVFDSFGYLASVPESDHKQFVREGLFLKAFEAMEIFTTKKDTGQLGQTKTPKLRRGHKIVVLDDIGREGILEFVNQKGTSQLEEKRNRYFAILDFCYENKISVFLTTNLTLLELQQFMGKAVWSRIKQRTVANHLVELNGFTDWREIEHVAATHEVADKHRLHRPVQATFDAALAGIPTGDQ